MKKKKKIKNMNSKMTNSQLPKTKSKKNKNKLSKQLGQEQTPRHRDHMEGYQWGRGRGENGGKDTENK